MKKQILPLFYILLVSTLIFTGCSKDDTTPPVVAINGAAATEVSLNSGAWTDPGATATDDEDGSVTVTSDASATNPNTNLVGTYTITYTSVDAAGNPGSAIRTVRVKNDAESFAGSYSVQDTIPGFVFNYSQTITVHTSINNRVVFNRFGDYANNTSIYAEKQPNGDLEIPNQTAANIGSGSGSCDIATHQFSSTGYSSTANGFVITYNDAITAPGSCVSSTTGVATYTKL